MMHNITLISTFHTEIGKCNSDELYKIISTIRPDVIFEELSVNLFDIVYNGNQVPNDCPEIKSIIRYLQNHQIKHIPVDIDPSLNQSFSDIEYLFNAFKKYTIYKDLDDELYLLMERDGFTYLNSIACSDLFYKKIATEKQLMDFGINNRNLITSMYKLFHEEQDNRENEMLDKIYNYSKENQYDQAVFLLGCAHRNSMVKKIAEREKVSTLKLNWTFYISIETP